MEHILLLDPTPGQQKVREIVEGVLSSTDFDSEKDNQLDIYNILYKALAEDPIVISDSITGAKISEYNISSTYLCWIAKLSTNKIDDTPFTVDYTRLVTNGSVNGSWLKDFERKIYLGGIAQPKTTARALLTLGTGNHVGTEFMNISHYPNSKITIVHFGNHRALAYKLYGVRSLPREIITIYDDSEHDEQLNEALLYLEKTLDTERLEFKNPVSVKRLTHFLHLHNEIIPIVLEHLKTRIKSSVEDLLMVGNIQMTINNWFKKSKWKQSIYTVLGRGLTYSLTDKEREYYRIFFRDHDD